MKILLAALLFASNSNACTEYVGYLDVHYPTYETFISGTILGTTDDGRYLRFTLFGYAPRPANVPQPAKGDVSTDFVVRDKMVREVIFDENECSFIISFDVAQGT